MTAAPVYDIGQFLKDPHVQERGIVVEVPDDDMGTVPMHAVVPRLGAPLPPPPFPLPEPPRRFVFFRCEGKRPAALADAGRDPRGGALEQHRA